MRFTVAAVDAFCRFVLWPPGNVALLGPGRRMGRAGTGRLGRTLTRKGKVMIQLIAFIYGIVVLITGKFSLGKGRAAVGTPARIAGLVLVVTPILGFALGMMLAAMNLGLPQVAFLGLDLVMLVGSLAVAFMIASKAVKAQESGAAVGPYGAPPMA